MKWTKMPWSNKTGYECGDWIITPTTYRPMGRLGISRVWKKGWRVHNGARRLVRPPEHFTTLKRAKEWCEAQEGKP